MGFEYAYPKWHCFFNQKSKSMQGNETKWNFFTLNCSFLCSLWYDKTLETWFGDEKMIENGWGFEVDFDYGGK